MTNDVTRVGWRPKNYCRAIDKSRSWLYAWPPALQPRSIKIGRSRIIIEPPDQYLRRLAEETSS